MSYILDALKKSEKERRKGTLPDMLTVQDIVAEKPVKRFVWAYLLVAALVLNAGMFVWWSGFFQTKETKIVKNSVPEVAPPLSANETTQEIAGRGTLPPESADSTNPDFNSIDRNIAPVPINPVSPPVDKNSLRNTAPETIVDVRKKRLPPNAVLPKETARAVEPFPVNPDQGEDAGRLLSEPEGKSAATIDENKIYSSIRQKLPSFSIPPDENKIYKIKELPLSVRQNLPSFSITALMYSSTPASRMIRVNDQMMYEGQDLTAGVTVDEITKDGVIFKHQKYRFFVGVK